MADNDCLHLLHLDLAGLPRKNHAQSLHRSQILGDLRAMQALQMVPSNGTCFSKRVCTCICEIARSA
jgi:hypothetical protein